MLACNWKVLALLTPSPSQVSKTSTPKMEIDDIAMVIVADSALQLQWELCQVSVLYDIWQVSRAIFKFKNCTLPSVSAIWQVLCAIFKFKNCTCFEFAAWPAWARGKMLKRKKTGKRAGARGTLFSSGVSGSITSNKEARVAQSRTLGPWIAVGSATNATIIAFSKLLAFLAQPKFC